MKIFTRLLSAALVLVVFSATAAAQPMQGYVFSAPGLGNAEGDSSGFFHTGAGVELKLPMKLGAGAEFGVIAPFNDFSEFNNAGKLASVSGYWHLPAPLMPFDPYVFAGYSALLEESTAKGANFGFGTNFPLFGRLGFKVEFRGHVFSDGETDSNWWQGRFAVTF